MLSRYDRSLQVIFGYASRIYIMRGNLSPRGNLLKFSYILILMFSQMLNSLTSTLEHSQHVIDMFSKVNDFHLSYRSFSLSLNEIEMKFLANK